jgi:hypothetical protein
MFNPITAEALARAIHQDLLRDAEIARRAHPGPGAPARHETLRVGSLPQPAPIIGDRSVTDKGVAASWVTPLVSNRVLRKEDTMRVVTAGCDHLPRFRHCRWAGPGAGPDDGRERSGWVGPWCGSAPTRGPKWWGWKRASGYGRCLSECLTRAGFTVREIPTRLTASLRKHRSG